MDLEGLKVGGTRARERVAIHPLTLNILKEVFETDIENFFQDVLVKRSRSSVFSHPSRVDCDASSRQDQILWRCWVAMASENIRV